MNILVIGGSGAIGTPLVDILHKKGNNITITSRKKRTSLNRRTFVKCDGHNLNDLKKLIGNKDWDAIIDFLIYNTSEFGEHAKLVTSHTKQYIYVSSARVFAESETAITESSPKLLDICTDKEYLSTDEYALRKARCENILKQYDNYTIVRPSISFNENRLQLGVYEIENWLSRIINNKPIVLSNDFLSKITTMTYSGDVALVIAELCGNSKTLREDYNITTHESMTWQSIVDIYWEYLNKIGIYPQTITTQHSLNLKVPSLKYQVKYARLFNRRFDNTKIRTLLPELKFRDVKTELIHCLKANMELQHENLLSITNILQDRETGHILKKREVGNYKRYIKYLIARFAPEKLVINYLS